MPDGFVRIINSYGNIFEGTITPDGKRNGFCLAYIGYTIEIEIGWYENDLINGNYMKVNGNSFAIIE